jgi:hypothetical protein
MFGVLLKVVSGYAFYVKIMVGIIVAPRLLKTLK